MNASASFLVQPSITVQVFPSFWEAIDAVTRRSMARRKRATPDLLRTKLRVADAS